MPAESAMRRQTRSLFEGILGKKSSGSGTPSDTEQTREKVAESLERSLTKDDPLLETNTFNEDDAGRNGKDKWKEEESSPVNQDQNKENKEKNNEEPDKVKSEDAPLKIEPPQPKKEKWYKQFKFPLKKKKIPDSESVRSDAGSPAPPDDGEDGTETGTELMKKNENEEKQEHENTEEKQDNKPTQDIPSTSKVENNEQEPNESSPDLSISKPVPTPRKLPEISSTTIVDADASQQSVTRTESTARRKRRKKIPRKKKEDPETDIDPSTTIIENTAAEDTIETIPSASIPDPEDPGVAPPFEDDGLVLGVTVHHSDHLRADLKYMAHPVVRVSIVDGSSGAYLKKSNSSRRVTSFYESDSVTSVLPIMTQPFDFRANQSVLPRWEETLIFNESFSSLVASRSVQLDPVQTGSAEVETTPVDVSVKAPSPILFFVIRDFVSMSKANNVRKHRDDVDKGWHNVAWAFLKLVGSNGKPNTGRRVRLQLFHPPRNISAISMEAQSEPAFSWWLNHRRATYPSTIYVTLKSVTGASKMDPVPRSMFAMQPECGAQTYKQMHNSLQFADGTNNENQQSEPKWTRLPGQTCKIPNTVSLKLWAGTDGAFSIRFSKSGTRIAVACKHGPIYPILLYSIPGGEEMGALVGHQQLVYDIQWSNDSSKLVSASADGTAQVWDLNDKSKSTHTLVHPSYVYTSSFHPTAQYIVATGGYDCVIRVWSIASSTTQMLQELDGHKSLINSLVFDHSGLTLYSADSAGLVVAWNCHSHEKPRKKTKIDWSVKTKYEERELSGVCINCIQVHPRNNKLLLHCRDSTIRMLDVRIHTLVKYSGSSNLRQLIRSDLTSCGSFVISGSEDGSAYVWNAESGDQVATFNELQFSRSVRDVTFHPHDHIVAFSCFGQNMPVLVYKYDKQVAAAEAGLVPVVASTAQLDADTGNRAMINDSRLGESYRGGNRVDHIRQQLDSVQQSSPRRSALRSSSPSAGHFNTTRGDPLTSYGPGNTLSTWGSTFDSTHRSMLEPSYLSPHASPEARLIAQHYTQHQPREDDQHGWKPTFAAVGGSPYKAVLGPDVSLTVDGTGNTSLRVTSATGVKPQHTVVALYDYQANRSDEITIVRGDIIRVLYKDGPTWWFGELVSDGRQGYFPSNYVAINDNESVEDKLEKQEASPEVMFGVPEERPVSAESINGKTIHALKMPGGKLNFYSQSESEGDEERLGSLSISRSSRQRRRQNRSPTSQLSIPHIGDDVTIIDDVTDDITTTPKPRARTIKREKSPKASPRTSNPAPPRQLPTLPPKAPTPTKHVTIVDVHDEPVSTPPKKRKPKKKKETSEQSETAPETDVTPSITQPSPRFGILKAVQARMASESSFSNSVLGGAGFESEKPTPGRLDPILTSTATKQKKTRSTHRKTPKVLITQPSEQDESIPMLELGTSVIQGNPNPAFDNASEV
ncbi:jouberin-like isoform X2 [Ciona intestinalis]